MNERKPTDRETNELYLALAATAVKLSEEIEKKHARPLDHPGIASMLLKFKPLIFVHGLLTIEIAHGLPFEVPEIGREPLFISELIPKAIGPERLHVWMVGIGKKMMLTVPETVTEMIAMGFHFRLRAASSSGSNGSGAQYVPGWKS